MDTGGEGREAKTESSSTTDAKAGTGAPTPRPTSRMGLVLGGLAGLLILAGAIYYFADQRAGTEVATETGSERPADNPTIAQTPRPPDSSNKPALSTTPPQEQKAAPAQSPPPSEPQQSASAVPPAPTPPAEAPATPPATSVAPPPTVAAPPAAPAPRLQRSCRIRRPALNLPRANGRWTPPKPYRARLPPERPRQLRRRSPQCATNRRRCPIRRRQHRKKRTFWS